MAVRVGSADVGERVTVRRLLVAAPPGGRPVLGDVVGRLLRADADALEVQPASGAAVVVPRADVVAARVVGARR